MRSPAAAAGDFVLSAFALQGQSTILAWIKNPHHQYFAPDPRAIDGATIALAGVADGAWIASWLDTRSGASTSAGTVEARDGRVTLAVPTFSRDIALRLRRSR